MRALCVVCAVRVKAYVKHADRIECLHCVAAHAESETFELSRRSFISARKAAIPTDSAVDGGETAAAAAGPPATNVMQRVATALVDRFRRPVREAYKFEPGTKMMVACYR